MAHLFSSEFPHILHPSHLTLFSQIQASFFSWMGAVVNAIITVQLEQS